jgi:hypothetical protein
MTDEAAHDQPQSFDSNAMPGESSTSISSTSAYR